MLLSAFWIIPLVQGFFMSLNPDFPQEGVEYSLFENYSRIISDKNFKKACINNFKYTASVILIVLPMALFLSLILNNIKSKRFKYFFLFCLLLPGLIPPSIMGVLFNLTFNGRNGILNQVFILPFDGKVIHWMRDPNYIMTSLIIQAVWRWLGFITLFMLCALEAVPKNIKEAATMDGSGKLRSYLSIEIPYIKHVIIFCAAFLFIDTISLFSGSYSLLGNSGGTANAGLVLSNYSYAFTSFRQYNLASTVSIMILPVLMLLTAFFCLRRRKE